MHRQALSALVQATETTMAEETIAAVYDTAPHAEAAVQDLLAANVPQSAIHRHTAEGSYAASGATPMQRPTEGQGFWSSLFGGGGGEADQAVYDSTLSKGGNVVTVTGVPGHDFDAVMAILERHNPVDIDERAASMTQTATTSVTPSMTTAAPARTAQAATGGDTMQLSAEELVVGKRLVNQGGARIRRYVVETPVSEEVRLQSERVTLDRRPVTDGRPVTDDSFGEKTIEMTETAEEAVVSKTARVVEEVALRKEAVERVETVRDTVRKEEIEVEQLPGDAVRGAAVEMNKPKG